jgi:hypothetical protein
LYHYEHQAPENEEWSGLALCDPCVGHLGRIDNSWVDSQPVPTVGKAYIQIPLYDHTTVAEALAIVREIQDRFQFSQEPQLVLGG